MTAVSIDGYTVHVHDEGSDVDYRLWATVEELPGLFASGRDEYELQDALNETIDGYLKEPVPDFTPVPDKTGEK